jgi:hypothetical protein
MRKISVKIFVFIIIVLVVVLVALNLLSSHGVLVRIRNESQRKIEIADINYTGGSTGPIIIDAGKSFEFYVNPAVQCYELNIRHIGRDGAHLYKNINTYITHNDEGSVEVTIDANDVVTGINHIKSTFF